MNNRDQENKVLRWLRLNPDSTADEVLVATGVGVGSARKFTSQTGTGKNIRYRVDNEKLSAYLSKS